MITGNGLDRGARVYVAGHHGLAGSAIWRALAADGFWAWSRPLAEVDLRDRAATFDHLLTTRPTSSCWPRPGSGESSRTTPARRSSSPRTCASRST